LSRTASAVTGFHFIFSAQHATRLEFETPWKSVWRPFSGPLRGGLVARIATRIERGIHDAKAGTSHLPLDRGRYGRSGSCFHRRVEKDIPCNPAPISRCLPFPAEQGAQTGGTFQEIAEADRAAPELDRRVTAVNRERQGASKRWVWQARRSSAFATPKTRSRICWSTWQIFGRFDWPGPRGARRGSSQGGSGGSFRTPALRRRQCEPLRYPGAARRYLAEKRGTVGPRARSKFRQHAVGRAGHRIFTIASFGRGTQKVCAWGIAYRTNPAVCGQNCI